MLWLAKAPAGFGKTVWLTQVFESLRSAGARPCWLTLSADANQPARLLTYLRYALLPASDGASRIDIGQPETGRGIEDATSALINAIESEPRTCLLIDDAQVLTEPDALAVLDMIASHIQNTTLFIAGRRYQGSSFSRLGLAGRLRELGPKELRFEDDELAALAGSIDPAVRATINALTDGWPTAVQPVVERYTAEGVLGEDLPDLVNEYIEEQILQELGSPEVDVLQDLGVLGSATQELLERVSGGRHSWHTIGSVLDRGLVLATQSAGRTWYRCLPALKRYLNQRLSRLDAARVLMLHRRAAEWFGEQRMATQALEHASACHDDLYLLRTLEQLEPMRLGVESGTSILHFAEGLPSGLAHDFPLVALSQLYLAIEEGRFTEARALLGKLGQTLDAARAGAGGREEQFALCYRALACALACYDEQTIQPEEVHLLERHIYSATDASPTLIAAATGVLANVYVHLGRYDDALAAGDLALLGLREMRDQPAAFYLHVALGTASICMGRSREALPHVESALAIARQNLIPHGKAAFSATMLRARIHLEANELEAAAKRVAEAFEAGIPANCWLDAYTMAFDTAAALAACTKGFDEACSILKRAEQFARHRRMPRLRDFIEVIALREATLCGNYRAAMQILDGEIFTRLIGAATACPKDAWSVRLQARAEIEAARCLLAIGRIQDCEARLARVAAFIASDEDVMLRFTYHVIAMVAAFQLRRFTRAFECFNTVMAIGMGCSLIRLMLNHREQIVMVFDWSVQNGRAVPARTAAFVNSTLRFANATDSANAIRRQHLRSRGAQHTGFVLSPRETEILSLLAEGYSTKEIGRRLSISEGTAKTHRKKIYAKLGARTRAEVIAAARERLLI